MNIARILSAVFTLSILAVLVVGAAPASAQGTVPDTPDEPVGTAVFVGGVDLEWNEVPGADSYGVQMYRNGQWTDLPADGVTIAFYGAGAIISELEPEGSSYWFRVRAINAHGSSEWSDFNFMAPTSQSKSGRQARPDNVPASGEPIINGTVQAGEILTADTTRIEDGNGLGRVQFRYQWVSGDGNADTDIANATDSGYTLVSDDVGKTIKVKVAFTDRGGYSETRTSAATGAVAGRPNNPATGGPTIGGRAEVGEVLTADTTVIADADGLVNATYRYQWVANDGGTEADISGETDASYTLLADDEGKTIKVRVTFKDDADNDETLTSAATDEVSFAVQQQQASNTPATGLPTISGTAQVREILTAGTSGIADADGLNNVSYSYQWIRNDGSSDTDIQDATGSSYTLVDADEGKTIKVKVTFADDAGDEETLTSAATATVATRPNTPMTPAQADTTAPTISSVNITSDPDADIRTHGPYEIGGNGTGYHFQRDWYRIGDHITATVTFTEKITVTGAPELRINVGRSSKIAIFETANGTTAAFTYTVTEGDSETDGISIPANQLTLSGGTIKDDAGNDAVLSYSAVSTLSTHKVDGIRPTLNRLEVIALFGQKDSNRDIYTLGEELFVEATFSESVYGSISGPPQLTLDFDGETRLAEWETTAIPVWPTLFNYFIQEGDLDEDGVAISANAINLNGGFIKDGAGNDAILTHSAVESEFRVDTVPPTISSIAITSDPVEDDTYQRGEMVEVTVTFSEDVRVRSYWVGATGVPQTFIIPRLELDIGDEVRTADYLKSEGKDVVFEGREVVFYYTVQYGDTDENGIGIGADKIVNAYLPIPFLNGFSAIIDDAGHGADLSHDALSDNLGHKVDGASSLLTVSGETTVRYLENREDPAEKYAVSGSDADITWSLSGDDADIFSISENSRGDGELSFTSPPNYEDPADADRNNEYRVTIQTSDGTNTGGLQVIVWVTDDVNEVPVIVGEARVGETLTLDLSEVTPSARTMYYYWERIDGDTAIQVGESTDTSYTLTADDVGKTVRLTLSVYVEAYGYLYLVSEPTAVVSGSGVFE